MKPIIFNYNDYRIFIKEWFEWKKEQNPLFSHRTFARIASLPSHNYLIRVINGNRNISADYIKLVIKGMKLSKEEGDFFYLLKSLDSEKSSEKKTVIFKKLLSFRDRYSTMVLEEERLLFYEKWYYPLIWELANFVNFHEDYSLLGSLCIPKISEKEAKEAVKMLLHLKLLNKNRDGTYNQVSPTVTTGDEVRAAVVRNYHRQHLLNSEIKLDLVPPEERDISSVTVPASKESFLKMKKVIQDCRKELLEIAESDKSPDAVYLVGFQLLPQSKRFSEE